MSPVPESVMEEFRERARSEPPPPDHVAIQVYRVARAAAQRQRRETEPKERP